MADSKQSNVKQEYNVASKGLNLDNSQNNIDKGILTYALNAVMENFDANSFQYQNEQGNDPCFDFPEGFQLIGKYFIPEKKKILFWLKNDDTGESEIGYMENNDCNYQTLVNDDCLNFDINRPILSGAHRILDNGEVEIYWADNNGRRYLNIDDIPYLPLSTSSTCDTIDSTSLDCNSILLQPDLNIPITQASDVISGGEITTGTYQFTIQYADEDGNAYTAFYNVTNPMPVADVETATVNFNLPVGKSIIVDILNLDPLGTYEYFNLAVIKTVNNIPSVELVGTYFIDDTSKQIIYTGQNKTNIRLTIADIYEKFAFYEGADHVTAVQDILVWKGMKPTERLSYQKVANNITLKWQTYRIPPEDEGYANEVNAGNLRGYLRDEIYAFEISFFLTNGKETDAFHIPGRKVGPGEIVHDDIAPDNPDYIGDGETSSKFWEVYNTAEVEGFSEEFSDNVINETITVDYCTYELRQGGPDQNLGNIFDIEYTDLEGSVRTMTVDESVLYVDSTTLPVVTFGQGIISEVKCDSVVSNSITVKSKGYKGPYQYGSFAYWESTEEYPCDSEVWGDLAGEKIRHHKFPDCRVSPIIESSLLNGAPVMEDVAIYPIGVLIDSDQVEQLIKDSDLEQEEKDKIVGYKITRANRGVNKSIVAKGMLRNVNKYEREGQEYFYPNYPYNDITADPFLDASNNAWSQLCKTFTVDITDLEYHSEDGETYTEVSFIDCNTNKSETRKFYQTGVEEMCSITMPTMSSALGTVRESTYEVWRIYVTSTGVQYCGGFGAEWTDPYGETQYEWVEGYPTLSSYEVDVLAGTEPICINNCDSCGNHIEYVRTVEGTKDCSTSTDLAPIKDDPSLTTRQIFNSPETSFGQPFLGSILSLETVMYGGGKAHFVEVKDNAKYRLVTKEAQEDALSSAESVADLTQDFSLEAMFAVYNAQLTLYVNGITKRNFARSYNSIASYNYSNAVPINLGIKNRNLDINRYLIPEVLNVGDDDINVNNFNRETSVYLRATETIPFPDATLESNHNILLKDKSRTTIGDLGNCSTPEKEEPISVVSYYGSLKNRFINQYGQIYSYESIDTGFIKMFNNPSLTDNVIWGGDTYIGRFAYKTKLPFFIDNRVNFPDDSDIFYDEIGNIGYPKYWHSSRSVLETWHGNIKDDLILENFISYKAHNFDCPNDQTLIPEDADPDTNPDRTFYDGYFYMFAYGVPSFYCESSYNLDLRTARDNKEGDFWPHVSSGIPDNWVQETNVPIVQDNIYNYNVTFSKQNKETVITNLPANWDGKNEIEYYPFRAVYSDKQISNVNNRLNNWLIYRPSSYVDFPQNYGNLIALDSLQNSAILARFENKSLLYNSLVTIDTSNPQAAYVGNPNLFTNQPIDYAETDQGYMGSQNKFILRTPYGAVSVDAKRGHVFLINGKQADDLTQYGSGMQRWFTAHLPFEIKKYFPGVNTDNHFNGIGLHGVFDSNYERILITKLDYVPLSDKIEFRDNSYYITDNGIEKEIYLIDSDYFCNVSWTISFNFNSKSWISFHSYIPNWYVGENNFFYSGLNYCPNDFDVLVGVRDTTVPTTSTTTTLPLTTTTTTTAYVAPPDCSFDVVAIVPVCDLEGDGVFVNDPVVPPCERPENLTNAYIYYGYKLSGVDYDTTGSSDAACIGISYYAIQGSVPDLTMLTMGVQWNGLSVGSSVYLGTNVTDCTCAPDGWYYTSESAESSNMTFRVENCEIAETFICGTVVDPTTTTTTTTVVLPYDTTCFTGVYTEPDPIHPLGGVINYVDQFGVTNVLTHIWDTSYEQITYSDIISSSGVAIILCERMVAFSDGKSIVTAKLGANPYPIWGESNGIADAQAFLIGYTPIEGVTDGVAYVDGALSYRLPIEGITDGIATTSADAGYLISIPGTSESSATVNGDLGGNGYLSANVSGDTTVTGGMLAYARGHVSSNGVATVSAVWTAKFNGEAVSNSVTTVTGQLTPKLLGVVNASSTTSGQLLQTLFYDSNIADMKLTGDCSIIAYGYQNNYGTIEGSTYGRGLTKIDQCGKIDAEFATNIGSGLVNDTAYTNQGIYVSHDGSIFVAGYYTNFNGETTNRIVKLHPNGTRDYTFNIGTGLNNFANVPFVDLDGSVYIGGLFSSYNGTPQYRFTKLDETGVIDPTFISGSGFNNNVQQILPIDNDRIFVQGYWTVYNGVGANKMAILNKADGTLDSSFSSGSGPNNSGNSQPMKIAYVGDGFVVTSRYNVNFYNGVSVPNNMFKINMDGSLNTAFNSNLGTGFNATVLDVKFIDNKILVTHASDTLNGVAVPYFLRFNLDGTLDNTFNYSLNQYPYSIGIVKLGDFYYIPGWIGGATGYETAPTKVSMTGEVTFLMGNDDASVVLSDCSTTDIPCDHVLDGTSYGKATVDGVLTKNVSPIFGESNGTALAQLEV